MDIDIIKINISGRKFEVDKSIFKQTPDKPACVRTFSNSEEPSRHVNCSGNILTHLDLDESKHYSKSTGEFYFRQNADIFTCVLDFYNTGQMHYPQNMCGELVKTELEFWGFSVEVLASCCWQRYQTELDHTLVVERVRKMWNEEVPTKDELRNDCFRNKLYIFLQYPNYTKYSKCWSIIMTIFICISTLTYMMESVHSCRTGLPPMLAEVYENLTEGKILFYMTHTRSHISLAILEIIITFVLGLELLLRFFSYKCKAKFFKSVYNIVDIFAIVPIIIIGLMFTLTNAVPSFQSNETFLRVFFALNTFRILLRVLRFVRFAQHYRSLKLIQLAMLSSLKEMSLLAILLTIVAIFFANIISLAEIAQDNFNSILEGLWWAYITMTTVGYGDYPLWGAVCAMTGILVVALPVPIVVSNFSSYYTAALMVEREHKFNKPDNHRNQRNKVEAFSPKEH